MVKSKMNMEVIRRDMANFKKHVPSGKVLDFGCGSGFMSLLLADEGYDVTAVDLNSYNKYGKSEYNRIMTDDQINLWNSLKQKYSNLEFVHYEDKLPYADGSFDAVFAYAVLEHVPDELIPAVLNEVKRVLKPKGKLFMSRLPRMLSITEYIANRLHLDAHEKLYWDKEAVDVLNREGFNVKDKAHLEIFPAYPDRLTNPLFPIINVLDSILLLTPLKYISHHLRLVSEKK
jgi:2-polyprenyl-3-methyl-5-hydroxy-6-metoxy-1,4-benzoquinol methylase